MLLLCNVLVPPRAQCVVDWLCFCHSGGIIFGVRLLGVLRFSNRLIGIHALVLRLSCLILHVEKLRFVSVAVDDTEVLT